MIAESEKKFYRPDDYYTTVVHQGKKIEIDVITFDERKRTSIPSRNGLYVPEILLLSFCHQFPNPKNGYPGYWWFKYGIRDVKSVLDSLETRGFICLDEDSGKYKLTDLGKSEVEENEYVAYMHRNTKRTDFTVWDLNRMLGNGDKSHYLDIAGKVEGQIEKEVEARNIEFGKQIREINPEFASILDDQDKQFAQIQAAEERYKANNDVEELIGFWESIWAAGGLKFNGSHWTFRLPDLYIKVKRYDDALSILNKINKPEYQDKAEKYRERIAKKTINTRG